MKKLLFIAALSLATFAANAQIVSPAPSPAQSIEQVVGLTDVAIDYSRPAMRGRTIFGDLVPYDQVWRTGANANTTVTFSNDVMVGGKEVKAGTYALYTKPMKDNWEIYLYSDSENWGTPQKWEESKIAAKVMSPVWKMDMPVESFTITVDDVTAEGAKLGILWENTYVALPFEVPTDKAVMASIEKALSGPSAGDYYTAAVYYMNADKDTDKAVSYMEKAMSMMKEPAFWQLRQKSLLMAKAGKKDEAIKAAKESLAKAKEANNMDYVKMNQDSLKEWGAM